MSINEGLGWTFDTVAATYETMRPGYPPALYQALLSYCPIGPGNRVVEIGTGGGQATEPILQTGCELTAVEPGTQFSARLQEKFRAYSGFSVLTEKFEDTALEPDTYDLIFSASAFHWIPEPVGYEKVFSLLKRGGAFARFANHPFRNKENPALAEAIDEVYAAYYYPFHNKKPAPLVEYTEADAIERAAIAQTYGFTDIRHAVFHRERVFSAKEYTRLLGTYSDHIVISEPTRTEFFAKIEQAIDRHGGRMVLHDTIDLQLARKG